MSTAINKPGWMLVDGLRIGQPDLVVWSATCRVAVRPQMYRRESRVLYELIFVAFHWFRILTHDHLLILTHITLTLHYINDSIQLHISSSRHNKTQKRNKTNKEFTFCVKKSNYATHQIWLIHWISRKWQREFCFCVLQVKRASYWQVFTADTGAFSMGTSQRLY